MLEKTLESPLDCKEIQPVHPKGNQSWTCIGRTDAEGEALILWPPDAKRQKFEGKSRRGEIEDEIVRWYHCLHGHKLSKLQETVQDSGAWHVIVPRVTKRQTWLNDWTTSVIKYNKVSALMSLVLYNVSIHYIIFLPYSPEQE